MIDAIRHERWKWPPVRRTYVEKPIKVGNDHSACQIGQPKVVQEIVRSIIKAYYEPQFSDHSHGFRPRREWRTALIEIHKTWTGAKWFIEGDVKGASITSITTP